MFGIGMTELLVIFVVALLVLGPKRLPEIARSLGRGLAEFRRASTDMRREFLDFAEDVRVEEPKPGPGKAAAADGAAPGAEEGTGSPEPGPGPAEGPGSEAKAGEAQAPAKNG